MKSNPIYVSYLLIVFIDMSGNEAIDRERDSKRRKKNNRDGKFRDLKNDNILNDTYKLTHWYNSSSDTNTRILSMLPMYQEFLLQAIYEIVRCSMTT